MMNAAWNNSPPALSAESLLAVWKRDVRSSQDGDEFLRIVLEDRDGAYPIAGWAIRVVQAVCDRVRTKRAELDANAARVLASWSPTVALTQTFNFNFDQQQPVQQQPVPQAVPLPGFNLPWHEQQLLSDAIAYRRKRLQNNLKIVPKTIRLRRKSVSPARPAAQSVSTEPAPVLIPQEVAMPQKRRAKRGRRGRARSCTRPAKAKWLP